MPKKPETKVDKELAKAEAAAEAARRLNDGKKNKGQFQNQAFVGLAACIGILAVVLVIMTPRKGADPKLEAYVNSHVSTVTAAADGSFTAAASPFFHRWSLGDAKYGLAGITVSNMLGISGAVQVCAADEGTESGAIPPSYDARETHAACFSDAQDSGNCSASYAIAATDVLATRYCISDNVKYAGLRLSAQQILSCDKKSKGCKGGGVDNVWAYMQRRGLYPEKCLPYAGQKGAACKTECKEEDKLKILEHCVLTKEKAIKREIYNRGPVVAPMYIKSEYLVYGAGVYTPTKAAEQVYDPEGHAIQHAVSIVGWGKSQGTPYWIVKHSWGQGWGENGYARVAFDTVVRDSYVVVGVPATEEAIQAAEQRKIDEEKAKEERKKERVERDRRIKENREKMEAEKGASEEATDANKQESEEAEAEVDLDAAN